jgi:hypothetical protein
MLIRAGVFALGLSLAFGTFLSALSTFVLPRSARSQLNRLVFASLRRVFEVLMKPMRTFEQKDAIMGYYAPIGLLSLVPTWYMLVALGYTAMYWALGAGSWAAAFRLSGSSVLTLGIAQSESLLITALVFSEAMLGLIMVALLIAYLPTMYAAFSRREEAVNLLEVRAGSPPSAVEMILRYQRIHGLEKLGDYWRLWEVWFADLEESHTVLPALVFFRSPRAANSWITASGAVLDAAALTLSSVDIPAESSAALAIRAGFLALRRIADYFEIDYPSDPHFPQVPIGVLRSEFEAALDRLAEMGVRLKADRDAAWQDFGGWRVNYDRVLLALCSLTMAPRAVWSSDRAPRARMPRLLLLHRKR